VTGGYTTDLVAPASTFVPKPAELAWEPAAGLMLAGATAVHLLGAVGVGAGDTVLVHGAAGGVGQTAIQLAVARGARVVATASPRNDGLLRELGAQPVVYGDGLLDRVRAAAPAGVTTALDLVGTDEAMDVSLALVEDRSRVATIVAFARGLADGVKVLGNAPGADPGTEIRAAARLQLTEAVRRGELRVLVARTYPLAEAAKAHRDSIDGHTAGKIILVP
jgi:NADPH:quinone reductase-like Zn-dependent oxidoreductase